MNVLHTYNRYPLTLISGQGSRVQDDVGKEYIDLVAGIAVASLGHCDPDLVNVLDRQSRQLWHTSNLYGNLQQEQAAAALANATGLDRFFFANSGAEANEGLIKLARSHGQRIGRTAIIALNQSFHGRTTGAMALTGQAKIHDGFGPLLTDIHHVDANDIDALASAIREHDPCAVLVEPVLAEGGGIFLTREYMQAARKLCTENNVLLMCDEVQTGIGRLGESLGVHTVGVLPDAISLAKGMAGGFPVGAIGVKQEYAELLGPGMHASTFGGSLLASALTTAVVERVCTPGFLANVRAKGAIIEATLQQLKADSKVSHFCGRGLWWIFEPTSSSGTAIEIELSLRKAGVLVLPTQGRLIRMLPALNIEDDVLREALTIIDATLRSGS